MLTPYAPNVTAPPSATEQSTAIATHARRGRVRRLCRASWGTVGGITVLVVVALLVPSAREPVAHDWGPSHWALRHFCWCATKIVCCHSIPRTAFTLAAGLLFGSVVGVFIAVVGAPLARYRDAAGILRATGWRLGWSGARRASTGWTSVCVSELGGRSLRLIPIVRSRLIMPPAPRACGSVPSPGRPWQSLLPATAAWSSRRRVRR